MYRRQRNDAMGDPGPPHVAHEQLTLGFMPTVVMGFDDLTGGIGKIVAVSDDAPLLARVEAEAKAALGDRAAIIRSQAAYLDVTNPLANKGDAVTALTRLIGVDLDHTAVIGDMFNDVAMFDRAAYAVAMGQAPDEVKARADAVTGANTDDGFAWALEHLILPRARRAAP
jgi:hydroxymethylpyrimidine pyrophosphatase-like HAD family hydrolase